MQQLSDLIDEINKEQTNLDRKKLITLCTIDVHARDVVQRLIDDRVEDGMCFQWQSQLRYYQNEKTKNSQVRLAHMASSQPAAVRKLCNHPTSLHTITCRTLAGTPSGCNWHEQILAATFASATLTFTFQVNICDAEIVYNSEYIGNCGCLCITPLTDRCYITLTQAQRLVLGGAPAGWVWP